MTYSSSFDVMDTLKSILPYFIFFRIVFWMSYYSGSFIKGYNELSPVDKGEWGSAICSSMLSLYLPYVVVTIGAKSGKYLFFDYPLDNKDDDFVYLAHVMIGYFAADLIPIVQHQGKEWYIFAIHHISGAWYFYNCLQYEICQGSLMSVCLVELSNFFNNNRLYMSKALANSGKSFSKEYPNINLGNGVCFTFSFFVLRILGFTHIGWWTLWKQRQVLTQSSMHFQISSHVCFLTGISMQFYWFFKILKGLIDLIKKTKVDTKNKK